MSSCRKESGQPSNTPSSNSWTYAGTTLTTAFSETDDRGGYKITFRPPGAMGLTHGISFKFTEKPVSGGSYATVRNPGGRSQVTVILQTDTISSYYSTGGEGASMRAAIESGKLRLTGEQIRVIRDTIPAFTDTLNVSFDLLEY